MKISGELMEKWFDLLEQYKPDEIYKDIPKDDLTTYYTLKVIKDRELSNKERKHKKEFYIKGYSLIYGISEEDTNKLDYAEVKEKIITFRRDYE